VWWNGRYNECELLYLLRIKTENRIFI